MTSTKTTARSTRSTAKSAAPKAAPAKPVTERKPAKRSTESLLKGYEVKWPHTGYDLLRKTAASPANGPKWYVRCNEHSALWGVGGTREGDLAGRRDQRALWCAACAKAAKA